MSGERKAPTLPDGWRSTEGDGSPYFTLTNGECQIQCVSPEDGGEPLFIRGRVSLTHLKAIIAYLDHTHPGIAP